MRSEAALIREARADWDNRRPVAVLCDATYGFCICDNRDGHNGGHSCVCGSIWRIIGGRVEVLVPPPDMP